MFLSNVLSLVFIVIIFFLQILAAFLFCFVFFFYHLLCIDLEQLDCASGIAFSMFLTLLLNSTPK